MRRAAAVLVVVTALTGGPARADELPRVEVEDLPPLPDEEASLGQDADLAVLSATSTEEDVVVGAAKREQSLGNVASAVTVVSGDRLRRMGYRTVAEALRGVAGVFIADDRLTERVGVRGLQVLGDFNTRVLVLIDGATVNEPWNQFAGLGWDTLVSIDDVARVEVIRGPVSSVYGTNAFFGIINIVTRGATEAPRAWGRIGAGQFTSGSFAAGFATGDVDHQLRGSVAATGRGGEVLDVPELGDGIDADGMRAINAGLVGVYEGAFAQVRFVRRERELAFAPYSSDIGEPDNRNIDTQLMIEGGYTRELSDRVTVTGRLYLNRYRFRDFLTLADGTGVFADIGDSAWAGVELRGRLELLDGDRLGVTTGGETTLIRTDSQAWLENSGEPPVEVETNFDVEGVYAELDGAPLPWLAFTAGVRFDRHSLLDDRVSPRAALFASKKDRYGAKLLYSEGFRNPSAFEAFFKDEIDFTNNPLIKAETIRSFEAVMWGRPLRGLTARLSAFSWVADGLVEQEPIDVDGMEQLQFQNVGTLESVGLELEASYRHADGWFGFGGAAITEVTADDGDPMTVDVAYGAPAVSGVLGVSSPRLWGEVHLSTEVHAIGPRPVRVADGAAPRETDPYAGVGVALYAPDLRKLDLTIGVRNLLGVREQVPAAEDFDRTDDAGAPTVLATVPGEGREVYARLGYRY